MISTLKIIIINGPNLNMLGKREPEYYGNSTLEVINDTCSKVGEANGVDIDFKQSNDESEIIGWIQGVPEDTGIIINAGAYTHTSIAIHDALKLSPSPAIEVHISNIYKREEFRQKSYLSSAVDGLIVGFGENSYVLAIEAMRKILIQKDKK
tara:strand:+ start:6660 stop:7115 length:456 start_codon:yes stop_codon:yes gene_type:complete